MPATLLKEHPSQLFLKDIDQRCRKKYILELHKKLLFVAHPVWQNTTQGLLPKLNMKQIIIIL